MFHLLLYDEMSAEKIHTFIAFLPFLKTLHRHELMLELLARKSTACTSKCTHVGAPTMQLFCLFSCPEASSPAELELSQLMNSVCSTELKTVRSDVSRKSLPYLSVWELFCLACCPHKKLLCAIKTIISAFATGQIS